MWACLAILLEFGHSPAGLEGGERASNCRSKAVAVSNGQPQPQPEHTSQD